MEQVFFIDRCFGRVKFVSVLREGGLNCVVHDDEFPQDADDVDWIPPVASRGWYAVSRDNRIKKTEAEKDIVVSSCLGLFLLTQGKRSVEQMAAHFLLALPLIERFVRDNTPPFIVSVRPPRKGYKRGELFVIHPPKDK